VSNSSSLLLFCMRARSSQEWTCWIISNSNCCWNDELLSPAAGGIAEYVGAQTISKDGVLVSLCHCLKQGGNKLSGRHSLLTPTLPPEEGKRRKSFTHNTNNTNHINNKRNNTEFPRVGYWVMVSHQQLPGSTRQSQNGLGSRQERDSGMHGLESGSGRQAG